MSAKPTRKTGQRGAIERSILDMSGSQARAFFLKPESYFRIELPPYFDFSGLLRPIARYLATNSLAVPMTVRRCEHVNHTIYSNKDGRFAWRPFQLIHPVLYVDLVDEITSPTGWALVKARFAEFSADDRIRCLSIPVASLTRRKDRAARILRWWHGIEQASINLALDFDLVFHADVADCYSSVYTHSVAWALHGKAEAKARRSDKTLLGNVLDARLQDMSYGQTNGIPQGSVLLDLIAEMVLGYADLELGKRLQQVADFRILRYLDDYRIFVKSAETGDLILKVLTEVLMNLGLKLNASKTTGSQAVVRTAIKDDKRAWMRGRQFDPNLQKHLLLIHAHGSDFPNAGSLIPALDGFYQRIGKAGTLPDPLQLISIAVDIGYSNPRCFHVCAAVVSKVMSTLKTKAEKRAVVARIRKKLDQLPNSGYLEVWLQRISYPVDSSLSYDDGLCRVVQGGHADLWESSWISDQKLKALVDPARMVNRRRLKTIKPVMARVEFTPFSVY